MRLIDADALRADCDIYNSWDAQIVKAWLDDQPTIDAVEVVRCQDCRFNFGGLCDSEGITSNALVEPDWFCKDGKRKEQNDE